MLKRAMAVLVLPFLVLLAACGTAAPQAGGYASEMAPAIDRLEKWQIHYGDFETLLLDTQSSPTGMSRLELLELYNMATEYKITREDYVSLGFSPLDALVGDAIKYAREGREIEAILSSATPDAEIQAAHQAVLKCVQVRDDFMEGLAASIRDLGPVDLSGDVSACNDFDTDLEQLAAYLKGN